MNGAWGKEKVILWVQIGAIALSLVSLFIFIHLFLREQSARYVEDFRRQNFQELLRGEVHVIGRKLAPVAKADFFSCVVAKRGEIIFFEEIRGTCSGGIFRVASSLHEPSHDISIQFVTQAPAVLIVGFSIFILLQLILACAVIYSQRAALRLAFQSDIALAVQARQFAHDIRSPLVAVKALAKGAELDPESLKRVARRLEEISQDLLPSRSGVGIAIEKIHRRTELTAAVREAVEEKRIEFTDKKDLEIDLHAAAAMWCDGEPILWKRMLSNLMNNAIEASDGGPARITMRLEVHNGLITVSVTDNGRGLPEHVRKRLGEASYFSGKKGGHGLGVSGAYRAMKELGGVIEFLPGGGGGTKVEITIPRKPPPVIVLLDDDQTILTLWKKASQKSHMEFHGFSAAISLFSGLETISREAIVFLDVDFSPDRHDGFKPVSDVGEKLARLKYENLFLCTGHPSGDLPELPWVKGIIGKEPPWLDV